MRSVTKSGRRECLGVYTRPRAADRPLVAGFDFADYRAYIREVESYGIYQERGFERWVEAAYLRNIPAEEFADAYLHAQDEVWSRDPDGWFAFMLELIGMRDEDSSIDVGDTGPANG